MSIRNNVERVLENINSCTIKSKRNPGEVKLLAVSKFQPLDKIHQAYEVGLRLFGENRVQEAVEKFDKLSLSDVSLHLIGSLQRNKVKKILPHVNCIQSVDRIELLQEFTKYDAAKNIQLLLEVHTGEESKKGFSSLKDLEEAIQYSITAGLNITGFMTMAPFTEDKKIIRNSFIQLRNTSNKMKELFPALHFPELSMGMSNDYEIAIEEGSTLVRIGTAIFSC